jgi:regulator of sigma E protease
MDWIIGLVLVLGVMILVHEWGHFIMARLFGVRVDVFSIGFGPRLFGWKRGATDYRISALPLGGYVRMAGQDPTEIDSPNRDWAHMRSGGSDKGASEQVSDATRKAAEFRGVDQPLRLGTGAPDELMSKPRWQRALISFAGPAVNLLFPILLLFGLYAFKGEPYPAYFDAPLQVVGLPANTPESNSLRVGDRVVDLNGAKNPTWEQADKVLGTVPTGSSISMQVENSGALRNVNLTLGKDSDQVFGFPPIPPVLDEVSPGLPADRAGLKAGDRIVSINGQPIQWWDQFRDRLRESNGAPVTLEVQRKNERKTFHMTPEKQPTPRGDEIFVIGVAVKEGYKYRPMPMTQSVSLAVDKTGETIASTVGIVGMLVSGRVSIKQLQGPVGISSEAGKAVKRGPASVLILMVLISVNLGILNLLPIPILDGGNILLLAIEGSLRRDLSMSFKERYVQVGLVFLLVIFAIVMYHDVLRQLPIHS